MHPLTILRGADTHSSDDPALFVANRSGRTNEISFELLVLGCISPVSRPLDLGPEVTNARNEIARSVGSKTRRREPMKNEVAGGITQQHATSRTLLCRHGLTDPAGSTKGVVGRSNRFESQNADTGKGAEMGSLTDLVGEVGEEGRSHRYQRPINAPSCEHEQSVSQAVTKCYRITFDEPHFLQRVEGTRHLALVAPGSRRELHHTQAVPGLAFDIGQRA